MNKLRILRSSFFGPDDTGAASTGTGETIPFENVKDWIAGGSILRRLFHWGEVELFTYRLAYIPKPFLAALLVRFLSHGRAFFADEAGERLEITLGVLARYFLRFLRDLSRIPALMGRIRTACARLERKRAENTPTPVLDLTRPPVYLRTDLWFGVKSGGSVGHIAGVLNHLDAFAGKPVFLTTDRIPTVREDLETHVIAPGDDFCGFSELPSLHFNMVFQKAALDKLDGRPVSFVYQRYSLNSLSGLALSRLRNVPFVLEYNGSEVWISRNWGKPLKNERLALRIEDLVLKSAHLVVVVSRPMRDELVKRGVPEDRILVNPNGVDARRYSPAVDGSGVRKRLGLEGKRVIGFIGTFGRWHGAEVLADAFGRLMGRRPDLKGDVRLLMVGDGTTLPEVKAALARHGVGDLARLTGLVPQEAGPAHLAACDYLAASHVPNADGTPFFGSPTKLFEYMAMGKGIVASDLDQIGEVLENGKTAVLVKPGDPEALATGLEQLLENPSLAGNLGHAARVEAEGRHTWEAHTGRIIEKLKHSCTLRG